MTKAEKSAICRILFDLIQADSIIDSNEITASQITFADAIILFPTQTMN